MNPAAAAAGGGAQGMPVGAAGAQGVPAAAGAGAAAAGSGGTQGGFMVRSRSTVAGSSIPGLYAKLPVPKVGTPAKRRDAGGSSSRAKRQKKKKKEGAAAGACEGEVAQGTQEDDGADGALQGLQEGGGGEQDMQAERGVGQEQEEEVGREQEEQGLQEGGEGTEQMQVEQGVRQQQEEQGIAREQGGQDDRGAAAAGAAAAPAAPAPAGFRVAPQRLNDALKLLEDIATEYWKEPGLLLRLMDRCALSEEEKQQLRGIDAGLQRTGEYMSGNAAAEASLGDGMHPP